jgi:hypothetical protein
MDKFAWLLNGFQVSEGLTESACGCDAKATVGICLSGYSEKQVTNPSPHFLSRLCSGM